MEWGVQGRAVLQRGCAFRTDVVGFVVPGGLQSFQEPDLRALGGEDAVPKASRRINNRCGPQRLAAKSTKICRDETRALVALAGSPSLAAVVPISIFVTRRPG